MPYDFRTGSERWHSQKEIAAEARVRADLKKEQIRQAEEAKQREDAAAAQAAKQWVGDTQRGGIPVPLPWAPDKPVFEPIFPEPTFTDEDVAELLPYLAAVKLSCHHCGKYTEISDPNLLRRLDDDRRTWIDDRQQVLDDMWRRNPFVVARAVAEQAAAEERARDLQAEAEVREREDAKRRAARGQYARQLVAVGMNPIEADVEAYAKYPDLEPSTVE